MKRTRKQVELEVGDPEADDTTSSISKYEKVRLENIKRNESFLAGIGLDETQAKLHETTHHKATKRGVSKPPSRAVVPTRRSQRVTVEKLKEELELAKHSGDASVPEKEAELQQLLSKNMSYAEEIALSSKEENPMWKRVGPGPVPLIPPKNQPEADDETSENISLDWGRPIIEQLTAEGRLLDEGKRERKMSDNCDDKLSLAADDVAKVTESRITSIWLHPTANKILCAAGDKVGYIGLWDVDSKSTGNGGVFKYRPHNENVMHLSSSNTEPSKLYSVSYDNTIRFLDLEKEAFVLSFEAPEETARFCDASVIENDCSQMFVGLMDGGVGRVDMRAHSDRFVWQHSCHGSKINTVQSFPTNSHLIVTASGGAQGCIFLHDSRMIRKLSSASSSSSWTPVLSLTGHSKSVTSAYASPDGQYLVSTSMDNTIRVWTGLDTNNASTKSNSKASNGGGGDKLAANVHSCVYKHNNYTGRWLSTFRPSFDPKRPHTFVLGSMDSPRKIEIFSPSSSSSTESAVSLKLVTNINGMVGGKSVGMNGTANQGKELIPLNSVCSRNCFHSTLNLIAAGNSSGRVHIFR